MQLPKPPFSLAERTAPITLGIRIRGGLSLRPSAGLYREAPIEVVQGRTSGKVGLVAEAEAAACRSNPAICIKTRMQVGPDSVKSNPPTAAWDGVFPINWRGHALSNHQHKKFLLTLVPEAWRLMSLPWAVVPMLWGFR